MPTELIEFKNMYKQRSSIRGLNLGFNIIKCNLFSCKSTFNSPQLHQNTNNPKKYNILPNMKQKVVHSSQLFVHFVSQMCSFMHNSAQNYVKMSHSSTFLLRFVQNCVLQLYKRGASPPRGFATTPQSKSYYPLAPNSSFFGIEGLGVGRPTGLFLYGPSALDIPGTAYRPRGEAPTGVVIVC